MDQVYAFELAPSTKMTDFEVTEVLANLFQLQDCLEYRSVMSFFESKASRYEHDPDFSVEDKKLDHFVQTYTHLSKKTLHLNSKEASGYGNLTLFALYVCDMMEEKYPGVKLMIQPQFYVCGSKQYSTDEALISVQSGKEVLAIWEYKPKVAASLIDQTAWHLSETILQAFFLKKHSVLHCLTDLEDFHYFFLECDPRHCKLIKYVYLKSKLSVKGDVLHHMDFLFHSIKIASST